MMTYTSVSTVHQNRVKIRGRDLVDDIMGELSFTQAIHLTLMGTDANEAQLTVLDAVLTALLDHGVTGSTLAARMTLNSAPEALQGAIAVGVLNSGTRFLGSMRGCARLLSEIADEVPESAGPDSVTAGVERALTKLFAAGRIVPGIGHRVHTEVDERANRLLEIARGCGGYGHHCSLMEEVRRSASRLKGREFPLNVTGAIAATMLDAGYPAEVLQGLGILSRIPGVLAHLMEEMESWYSEDLVRRIQRENYS
jgi:citrate synthase